MAMRRFRKLASMMGVEHAIILAPMAGGTSTPALVAAVSNAGGLGSLGAGYMAPDDIAKAIAEIRERTDKPFAVNLFAGGYDGTGSSDTAAMLKLIAPWHERLGLPPPTAPAGSLPPFEQQVDAVLRADVAVFSFTFGIPPVDIMRTMKERGTKLVGTATTVAEARALEQAGVDAIVAQGSEAGAHRGTFYRFARGQPGRNDRAGAPDGRRGCGSGDRIGRNYGRPRYRRRRGVGRQRRSTGNRLPGLPREWRAASAQGGDPRGPRRRHDANPRLQRPARARDHERVRGRDARPRGCAFALPGAEQPDPANAHCSGWAGRRRLPFVVGGASGVTRAGMPAAELVAQLLSETAAILASIAQ
jgi:hypothetical protein